MSFWDSISKPFVDAGNAAADAANAAAKAATDAANAAAKAATDLANEAAKEAADLANQAAKEAADAALAASQAATKAANDLLKQAAVAEKAAEQAVTDAANAAAKEASDDLAAVEKTLADAEKSVYDVATDTYNWASDLVSDTEKLTATVAAVSLSCAEQFATQEINTLSKEWKDTADALEKELVDTAKAIEKVGEEAYQWASANLCNIGLTAALSMGYIFAFGPQPESPEADAMSISLSGIVAAALAYEAKSIIAGTIAESVSPTIAAIPGVDVNEELLNNCLANCIYYSLDISPELWSNPATFGIVLAAATAPILANLICNSILPEGFDTPISV